MKTTFATRALASLRQSVPCILALGLGVGVSVAAARLAAMYETRHAEMQFAVIAENHFMVLQNGLNEYLNRLNAVQALFDSADTPVARDQFEAFTAPLLRESSAIVTLSWVPRVSNAERPEHERSAVSQGLSGYRIKAMKADGTMAVSPERDEYYPIFLATLPKASPLYGLDLGSEPDTLAEMDRARDTDRLGFSQVSGLVSTGRAHGGFLFSLPVFKRGLPHGTVEERRRNLAGFVHGSLITSKMIDGIIAATKTPKGLDLFFYDPEAGPQAQPSNIHPSRLRTTALDPLSRKAATSGLYWCRDLIVGGRPWLTMVVRPMPDGPLIAGHDRAWIVLFSGLIMTVAVVAYMRSSRRYAARMLLANRKVSELAQSDGLTGLANRRAFMVRLGGAFAAARRGATSFAVLYFDLDHFKDVNDTLGHVIGDELLRQIAARVAAAVRDNDVVARIGGDEFAILQCDADGPEAAGALAAKIRTTLAEPYQIDGNQIHISVSIGIACYQPDVAAPDALIIQADLALYRAKEDGRNCVRFHSAELDREINERVNLAEELRGASERGELELHYQPQVELRSGRIVGLEALLRWNHPKRGLISPAVFIPIAERSGQIEQIGRWVLDAACRQLQVWQADGVAPELVGVNISALHFKGSADLDRDVAISLAKCGIAPSAVEIELTESVLIDISQQHSDRFERLRQLGVRIAIDDFGTGYSSLSYLANYPVSRIKIAQELMFGVEADARSATVVRAAIRLAHELGIDIIAEGVETEGQAKFLLSEGCEHAQGYYFSKPVGAARATELLRAKTIKPARRSLRLVEYSAA